MMSRSKVVASLVALSVSTVLTGCGGGAGDGDTMTLHAVLRSPTDLEVDEDFDPAAEDMTCDVDGLFTGQRLSILDGKDVVGVATVRAGEIELSEGFPSACASRITTTFRGTSDHRVLRIGALDQAFSVAEADKSTRQKPVVFALPAADL